MRVCFKLVWLPLFLVLLVAAPLPAQPRAAQIRVNRANVRATPEKNARLLFRLGRGTRLEVLEEKGKWLRIRTAKGREGWLFSPLVRFVKPPLKEARVKFLVTPAPSLEQQDVIAALSRRLARKLAAPEPPELELTLSAFSPPVESSESAALAATAGKIRNNSWLLILRLQFNREDYSALKGEAANDGIIDLLPFLDFLDQLLNSRKLLLDKMQSQPGIWGENAEIKALLALSSQSGDEVLIGGYREQGFAVFKPYIMLDAHGFKRFSLTAALPANVSEFNQFVLPPARLPDGSLTAAALAYDFFGFTY